MVADLHFPHSFTWNILNSDGEPLAAAVLAQRLRAVPSIYTAPAIPAEYSELVGAERFFVNAALQDLNARIWIPPLELLLVRTTRLG